MVVVHEQSEELKDHRFRATLFEPGRYETLVFSTTPNERLLTVVVYTLGAAFCLSISIVLPPMLLGVPLLAPFWLLMIRSAYNKITLTTTGIEYHAGFASASASWSQIRAVDGSDRSVSIVVEDDAGLKVLPDQIGDFSGRFPGMHHSSRTRSWLRSPDGAELSYPGFVASIIDEWRRTAETG